MFVYVGLPQNLKDLKDHLAKTSRRNVTNYRGTSLVRNSAPLAPYSRTMPRALWWSQGGGLFLMSEVPSRDCPDSTRYMYPMHPFDPEMGYRGTSLIRECTLLEPYRSLCLGS